MPPNCEKGSTSAAQSRTMRARTNTQTPLPVDNGHSTDQAAPSSPKSPSAHRQMTAKPPKPTAAAEESTARQPVDSTR